MKCILLACFLLVICQYVQGDRLSRLLEEVERELEVREGPTTELPPTDDDDDTDDDDTGFNRPELLHELRGSCDVISAAGPYFFNGFPDGAVWDHQIEFSPANFTKDISLFIKAGNFAGNRRVYIRALVDAIGFSILGERMMCPGVKIQQAVIYLLRKELNNQLREEDGSLYSELLNIYRPVFGEDAVHYAHGSVMYAHKIIYEEVIHFILKRELKGLTTMIDKMTSVIRKRSKLGAMDMRKVKTVVRTFLKRYDSAIQCPAQTKVIKIFTDLADSVKIRLTNDEIKRDAVSTMKILLEDNMDLLKIPNPDKFFADVIGVFKSYMGKAIIKFNYIEKHFTQGNFRGIAEFAKKYLDEEQGRVIDDLVHWLSSSTDVPS